MKPADASRFFYCMEIFLQDFGKINIFAVTVK